MENLIGQKFGKLTVIKFFEFDKANRPKWECICDCGNTKVVSGRHLKNGSIQSCRCIHSQMMRDTFTTHGATIDNKRRPEYIAWNMMRQRCYNEKSKNYLQWGGRGITVCDRWRNSFENFFEDMGERPSKFHSLDRIENNGIYELSNCKWSTKSEQAINRRSTKWYEYNGERKILKDWATKFGVASSDINYFLRKKGRSFEFVYDHYMNNKVRRKDAVNSC